jgi:hypothetical protein
MEHFEAESFEENDFEFLNKKKERIVKCNSWQFFAMNFVKVKCRSAYGNVLTGFIKRIRVLNTGILSIFIDCPASRTIVSSSIINCFAWYRCIQILGLKWLAPFRGAIMCAMDIAGLFVVAKPWCSSISRLLSGLRMESFG